MMAASKSEVVLVYVTKATVEASTGIEYAKAVLHIPSTLGLKRTRVRLAYFRDCAWCICRMPFSSFFLVSKIPVVRFVDAEERCYGKVSRLRNGTS